MYYIHVFYTREGYPSVYAVTHDRLTESNVINIKRAYNYSDYQAIPIDDADLPRLLSMTREIMNEPKRKYYYTYKLEDGGRSASQRFSSICEMIDVLKVLSWGELQSVTFNTEI